MITAVFGPGAINAILAIGLFNIPVFTRVARGAAMGLWTREYVLAARTAGKSESPDLDPAHPAQSDEPSGRAGGDLVRRRHRGRGRAVLCRARRPAAHAQLGPDAGRGPDHDRLRPLAGCHAGSGHLHDRAGPQPDRRRPARPGSTRAFRSVGRERPRHSRPEPRRSVRRRSSRPSACPSPPARSSAWSAKAARANP